MVISCSARAGGSDEHLGLELCPSPYFLALTPSLGPWEREAGNFFPLPQEALQEAWSVGVGGQLLGR